VILDAGRTGRCRDRGIRHERHEAERLFRTDSLVGKLMLAEVSFPGFAERLV